MTSIYRIFTTSKGCVTVTAPQAARPPAINALGKYELHNRICLTHLPCRGERSRHRSCAGRKAGVVEKSQSECRKVRENDGIALLFLPAFSFADGAFVAIYA